MTIIVKTMEKHSIAIALLLAKQIILLFLTNFTGSFTISVCQEIIQVIELQIY